MVQTTAIETRALRCDRCGEMVYTCDGCKNYFERGQTIDCQMDYHYCESCEDKEVYSSPLEGSNGDKHTSKRGE